ncbi:heterokaryon incompatibility protein-domain-containing protein [Aspergillus ambiguus]|uniref:HET domain-containing protein n=1 Tax=Aspergillus ambiguus TaxID=176160 RepID=UPI003CCDB76A
MLCEFIAEAAAEVRTSVRVKHGGGSRGGHIVFDPRGKLADGRAVMRHFQYGDLPGDVVGETSPPSEPKPDRPAYQFNDDNTVRPWLFGNWWASNEGVGPLQLVGLGVRLSRTPLIEDAEGNGEEIYYPGTESTRVNLHFHGTFLRILADDDSPLANVIPGRLRTTDFASDLSMRRLEDRLQLCNRTHGATCAPWRLLNSKLPTRVLDVGVDSNASWIRLVEPVNTRSPYITLSHRWGDMTNIVMTTTSTIHEFRNGINMNMLPKVFGDAVFTCRRLRVRYLWIDTLCIIQDDKLDWERESARMADIYANSYLTIAASSSPHTCFPDFETRLDEVHVPPAAISIGLPSIANAAPMLDTRGNPSGHMWLRRKRFVAFRMQGDHDDDSWLYIHVGWTPSSTRKDPRPYFIGGFGRRFDPLDNEQLNSRGWTLQERLLSSRTIHYATDQMYWECEKTFVSEDGSFFDPTIFSLNSLVERQCLPASEHGFRQWGHTSYIEGDSPQMANLEGRRLGGWLEHVQKYSQRDLTVSRDKLPALSGLAAIIAARTGDEYLAGVWRDHVLEDLHWRVYRRDEFLNGIKVIRSERSSFAVVDDSLSSSYGDKVWDVAIPPASRGPSWSWASIDGRIRFAPLDCTRIRASFISCHIKNSILNRFGTVKKGWMRLFVRTLVGDTPKQANDLG